MLLSLSKNFPLNQPNAIEQSQSLAVVEKVSQNLYKTFEAILQNLSNLENNPESVLRYSSQDYVCIDV